MGGDSYSFKPRSLDWLLPSPRKQNTVVGVSGPSETFGDLSVHWADKARDPLLT